MDRPRLFLLLHRAREALFQKMNARTIDALGVTVPQLTALFHIVDHQQTTPGELATELEVDASAITRMVARLERKGLVRRSEAKHDRRVRVLALTEQGMALVERGQRGVAAANEEVTAGFTEQEMATVMRFLEQAIALSDSDS